MNKYKVSVYVTEVSEHFGTENNLAAEMFVFCSTDAHAEKMADAIAAGMNSQGAPTPPNCDRAVYWATSGAV